MDFENLKIGQHIALTEQAAKGLCLAMGLPVNHDLNDQITNPRKQDYVGNAFTMNPKARRQELPRYGVVTSFTRRLVTADWYYMAGKKAYTRTFPLIAVRPY